MNARTDHNSTANRGTRRDKVLVFLGDPTAAGADAIAQRAIAEAYAELAKLELALVRILGPDLYRLVSS
jgi:hypothetical protein